jgi:hypothetical protein
MLALAKLGDNLLGNSEGPNAWEMAEGKKKSTSVAQLGSKDESYNETSMTSGMEV